MITKNPMQLKAFIKNKAAEKHISAQLVMQNYMLERLLERISLSPYKNTFILKGGFLISAIVGLDTRATMDLDTTIKGFTLTHEAIRKIFTEICAVQIADDVQFEVVGISDIRETDDYPGIRVALKANYPPISVPLTVDVTTGDMITPREVEYTFSLLFDDRTISILAYNLETVLAEKLETVLSRNIANTRPRDYYDVHILYALRGAECDKATLRRALERTTQKRGSGMILTDYPEIMKEIRKSDTLRRLWEKYSREYEYAKDIAFDDTCYLPDSPDNVYFSGEDLAELVFDLQSFQDLDVRAENTYSEDNNGYNDDIDEIVARLSEIDVNWLIEIASDDGVLFDFVNFNYEQTWNNCLQEYSAEAYDEYLDEYVERAQNDAIDIYDSKKQDFEDVSDIFIRGIDSIIEVLKLVEELIDRYKDTRISADIDNA